MKKFVNIGILNKELKLLDSYHRNRKQYVQIGELKSNIRNVTTGVAQGSILSAPEFSIFINEIFSLKLKGKIQGYADDLALMHNSSNINELIQDLQVDLNILNNWLHNNKLELNANKTNYMLFQRKKVIDFSLLPNLYVNNIKIERATETKYLGLVIDEKLNWNAHITKIKNKIRPISFVLHRLKGCINNNALWNIYHSYVLTHINYLAPIWSNTTRNKIDEIQIIQNRILRIINGYSRLHSTNDLYSESVLPVDKLILFQVLMLVHKIKHNQIKHNFTITIRSDTHQHNTRRISHINIPFSRTNLGQSSAINRGFMEFNNLPPNIKHEARPAIFTKLIKKHIHRQL